MMFGPFFSKVLLATALLVQHRFEPVEKVPAIGIRQKNLTEKQLVVRERGIVDSLKFYIATQPKVLEDVERITSDKLQKVFVEASAKAGFPKEWLEAVAFLESGGKNDAKSPTGPVGLYQFTVAAALEEGLVKRSERYVTRKVGRGKNRKRVSVFAGYKISEDRRKDLQASADAAARRFVRMQHFYGRLDWAIQSHHSGSGNILSWIRAHAERPGLSFGEVGSYIQGQKLSYAEFFFSCSPAWKEQLYYALQTRMNGKRDYSPTYFFRIQAAGELLEWYRRDPKGFEEFVKASKNKYKPEKAAPSRMYAWFNQEDFFLKTMADLKAVKNTELVRVPDQPDLFGYYLRRTGSNPIGEADLANQDEYLYLRPPSAGLMAYVAYEFRLLYGEYRKRNPKAPPGPDLDIPSLIRTLQTQNGLKGFNATARTDWPTHTTAWAFDIAALQLTPAQKECLEFILQHLEWMGYLGFVEEQFSSVAFHVVPSPQGRNFFTKTWAEVETHVANYGGPEVKRGTYFAATKVKPVTKVKRTSVKKGFQKKASKPRTSSRRAKKR